MSIGEDVIDKVLNHLDMDTLKGDIAFVRDVSGEETAKVLLKTCMGLNFNVPKITTFKEAVAKYIQEELNRGKSIKSVALALDLNERKVRQIYQKFCNNRSNQPELFDVKAD